MLLILLTDVAHNVLSWLHAQDGRRPLCRLRTLRHGAGLVLHPGRLEYKGSELQQGSFAGHTPICGHHGAALTKLLTQSTIPDFRPKSRGCLAQDPWNFGKNKVSRHGLFDEYRLAVVPVILGSGRTLFGRSLNELKLKLLEARPLSSGAVNPSL